MCYHVSTSLTALPQEGEPVETEEEGGGGQRKSCPESVRFLPSAPSC